MSGAVDARKCSGWKRPGCRRCRRVITSYSIHYTKLYDASRPQVAVVDVALQGLYAFEVVPYISVVNLARSLDALKEAGFWCLGLAGEAEQTLAASRPGDAVALVLGAERNNFV